MRVSSNGVENEDTLGSVVKQIIVEQKESRLTPYINSAESEEVRFALNGIRRGIADNKLLRAAIRAAATGEKMVKVIDDVNKQLGEVRIRETIVGDVFEHAVAFNHSTFLYQLRPMLQEKNTRDILEGVLGAIKTSYTWESGK